MLSVYLPSFTFVVLFGSDNFVLACFSALWDLPALVVVDDFLHVDIVTGFLILLLFSLGKVLRFFETSDFSICFRPVCMVLF